MGIGQASGAAAAVCARNDTQPRDQNVAEIQSAITELGGLYRRDEARAAAEKARARKIAQDYIRAQHGRLITRPEILKQYENQ